MTEHGREQAEGVMRLLRVINHGLKNQLNSLFLEKLDLTLPQLIILRVVNSQENPPTSAEVVARVHLAPSTVSGIIKRLQRDEFMTTVEDPQDLRVHRLILTDKGRETVRTADSMYYDCIQEKLSGLTSAEIQQLADLLAKLSRAVEDEECGG